MNVKMNATNISPSRNVMTFGSSTASESSDPTSIIGTLSSYLTSWYGMIMIVLVVMILFWIYYETIGYYFSLGWNKMRWSHDNNEKINIEVPGIPVSADMKPVEHNNHNDNNDNDHDQSIIQKVESDVAKALGETGSKQVFNVARNLYKFEEAEPLCKAFGAELATYEQVKNAYKSGADWCNYGWSKGQMALFPTQKETYEKLQNGKEDQRMSCGVPGVNGGHFPNPDQRFGVNCYGERPVKTALNDRLEENSVSEIEFDREVNKFKSELDTIPVNPWAPKQWSA